MFTLRGDRICCGQAVSRVVLLSSCKLFKYIVTLFQALIEAQRKQHFALVKQNSVVITREVFHPQKTRVTMKVHPNSDVWGPEDTEDPEDEWTGRDFVMVSTWRQWGLTTDNINLLCRTLAKYFPF